MKTLYLERPSFWTETRDGEAWFRALVVLSQAPPAQLVGSPRSVWQQALSKSLSRRTALGLFGATEAKGDAILYGVGFMAESTSGWRLDEEVADLVARWQKHSPGVLEGLARLLIERSVWLRCLLCRLLDGDWALAEWSRVRAARRGLKPGESLLLRRFSEPTRWLEGLDDRVAGAWMGQTACQHLAVHPDVLGRESRRDDLSLAPLTAPLHLLESIGWLSSAGDLRLPPDLRAGLTRTASAAQTLTRLTADRADLRGFVAVEPVLRELLAAFGASPADEAFARWMDHVVGACVSTGAVEVLAAEPGQARHGRGLLGDPSRKLVQWAIHQEFDSCFEKAWAILGGQPVATEPSPALQDEDRT
jgi:hypothetical protein